MITNYFNKKISISWPPFGGNPRNPFPPKYNYFVVQQFFEYPFLKGEEGSFPEGIKGVTHPALQDNTPFCAFYSCG